MVTVTRCETYLTQDEFAHARYWLFFPLSYHLCCLPDTITQHSMFNARILITLFLYIYREIVVNNQKKFMNPT